MVAYTTAKNIAQVANSSYVGTWDVPTNSNWGIVDAALGQNVTIALNNSPVVLSAPQYQCAQITFSSTLTGNVAITFPSTFTGMYVIKNTCTGSSAFVITLQTTVAGGTAIGCPFGESFDVFNDGSNLSFRNLGRVGSYWDYAGSSTPLWVTTCTIPPYLNCDGTAFSTATYPVLANILGGATLPDARGRTRYALNQGTGRVTTAAGGLDGNTNLAGGGAATRTLSSLNIPPVPITDPGHVHLVPGQTLASTSAWNLYASPGGVGYQNSASAVTGISAGSTSPTAFGLVPPAYVGGITLIRSA